MAFRRRAANLLGYLELREGARVLDCGWDAGFYLMVMSELWELELAGLDDDPARLRDSRSLGTAAELVEGDAQRLPFEDGSFDAVLIWEVLEHLPSDLDALEEVARVLRPGGMFAVSVPHGALSLRLGSDQPRLDRKSAAGGFGTDGSWASGPTTSGSTRQGSWLIGFERRRVRSRRWRRRPQVRPVQAFSGLRDRKAIARARTGAGAASAEYRPLLRSQNRAIR